MLFCRHWFKIIYFHTKISRFSKGPATTLKDLYFKLSPEKQAKMHSINVVHASFFVRTRMMVIRSCFDRTEAFRKIHTYETIVTLLESIKDDVPMC